MAKNPPPVAPDLRLYTGKLHLRSEGDSNGQIVAGPRGESLLGRYSLVNGKVVESYGSTYTYRVMSALGIESEKFRSHGSARFGGIQYSTGWWVTPGQLHAIRAADAAIRQLDPVGRSYEEVAEAAIKAALAKMAE